MRWRTLMALVLLSQLALFGCIDSRPRSDRADRINGGGATFIQPIMEEWAYRYYGLTGIEVDYQAKGSGNGIQQMTVQTLDFGCSDAPMKRAQAEKARRTGGEVIHIPLIMGPVVAAYNLPGIDAPLTLDGAVLADIYLGKITTWNDPALKQLNPDIDLPELAISPVYRAEASGTTNIFKEFLAKCSEEFKRRVGVSTEPTWPQGVGTGERENSGVAGRIKSSAGTVGYVELRFAKTNGLKYARMRNPAGRTVAATPEGVTAAAKVAIKQPQTAEPYSLHELTFSLTYADGDDSYPISGVTYGVIYRKQPAAVGRTLKEFFLWCVRDGQEIAAQLDYAPLPADLVEKIEARLEQLELQP